MIKDYLLVSKRVYRVQIWGLRGRQDAEQYAGKS